MDSENQLKNKKSFKFRIHEVIFEADTRTGKLFDLILLGAIGLSVLAVMLESVEPLRVEYRKAFRIAEWSFTVLFTIEYVLRLISVRKPLKYALSFFGVIDFLAIIPAYLSFFIVGSHSLLVIRTVRLLRVFRVLKFARYIKAAQVLAQALRTSGPKIVVFLGTVLTLVIIFGSVMYMVEGQESGFTSIPKSVYWAIVTLTTVGYGDITPDTPVGQFLSAMIMILGYSIIAVPTGIVSVELSKAESGPISTQACLVCGRSGHDPEAVYCKYCGGPL